MRSKPVTQSNGVVVRKSSIRKLPNDPLKLLSRAEGVSLGIIGGVVPPGSPKPDPIWDQKMSIFIPFSDLAFKKLFHHHLDQNRNKTIS